MSTPPFQRAAEGQLLCPADGCWEVWTFGKRGVVRRTQTCPEPAAANVPRSSLLALPVRQVFSVPLWLVSGDPSLLADMVFLQLERRGLAGKSREATVIHHRVIAQRDGQTLVSVVVLPAGIPERLCLRGVENYDLSAHFYPLPPDHWTLWREEDRLVLAVTRGKELIYFQALLDRNVTEAVLQELHCIYLQLEAQGIIEGIAGVTLWGEFAEEEQAGLRDLFGLEVQMQPRPPPRLPEEFWHLMPHTVQSSQVERQKQRKGRKMFALAAVLYALLVGGLASHVGWLWYHAWTVRHSLVSQSALVKTIRETARRWEVLAPAIQPDFYPVEDLLRCARSLPPEGVRFTLFDRRGDKIVITGEAKNAAAVFKYNEDLQRNKDLASYKWEMPPPKLLPNDSSQFRIEGTRYHAQPDAK